MRSEEKRSPEPAGVESVWKGLLAGDPVALGRVIRWISGALTVPRFWSIRKDWPDVQQEVLLRVVESLRDERFDPSRDFRVYVLGIVRLTALQAIARQARLRPAAEVPDLPARDGVGAEELVSRLERIRRVLDLATDECRELIRMYFFDQLSYAEIAAESHLPLGTVKSRLFRCLESAHQVLAGRSADRSRRGDA